MGPGRLILYNGSTGGLGRHLAGRIAARGLRGHPIESRLEDLSALAHELDPLDVEDGVTFLHLAARVSVPAAEADPDEAYLVNVSLARSAVETVLSWASRKRADLRVIYVSTGHVYSAPRGHVRLTESADVAPRSVYARTKLEAEGELALIASAAGVPFLVARIFGLMAPGQAAHYLLPGLMDRVRRNDLTAIPGLDFVRDYLDARDVCEDLLLLGTVPWSNENTIINVCSGVPTGIRAVLAAVVEELRPSDAEDLARAASAAPGRPDDIDWLVGDPSRFVTVTGSPPQRIPLATTVRDAAAAEAR
jgi:nucleoside-diphosphate-sugar epimerase